MKKRNTNKHWYIKVTKLKKDINRHIFKRTRSYNFCDERGCYNNCHGHRYRSTFMAVVKSSNSQSHTLKEFYCKIKYLSLWI